MYYDSPIHQDTLEHLPTTLLITGATGFIGRSFLAALQASGIWSKRKGCCYAFVRPGYDGKLPAHYIEGDLAAPLPESRMPERVEAILHLAATRDRASYTLHTFPKQVSLHVDATVRLYDWARRHGVRRIVFVSTIAVYACPLDTQAVLTEESPLIEVPAHPYALSKKWAEEASRNYRTEFESVSIIRPCHVYGPGHMPTDPLGKVARAIEQGNPMSIASPDGDYLSPVFITDLTAVLGWLLANPGNHLVNIGGPTALHERQLINDVASRLGVLANFEFADKKPRSLCVVNRCLNKLYPDRPQTTWAQGLRQTWSK